MRAELGIHPAIGTVLGYIGALREHGQLQEWKDFLATNHPTSDLARFVQKMLPELDVSRIGNVSEKDLMAVAFSILLLDSTGYRKRRVQPVGGIMMPGMH